MDTLGLLSLHQLLYFCNFCKILSAIQNEKAVHKILVELSPCQLNQGTYGPPLFVSRD